MSYQIFIPNKLDLTFLAPNHCAKCHQNRIKIAAVGVLTNRLTEWPMLCYSNGTDKNEF